MSEDELVRTLSRQILEGIASGALASRRKVEEEKRRQLEEERRIWYVALTRARERLYITSPSLPDEMSENNPPFILELLREFEGRPEICSVVHLT